MEEDKRSPPIGFLVPKILLNQDPRTNLPKQTSAHDFRVKLLLVVGTSLKTPGAYRLAKAMVDDIHKQGGATVYIDKCTPPKDVAKLFDLHLQVDIEEWAGRMMPIVGKVSKILVSLVPCIRC